MSDLLNEKVSQFLDNELTKADTLQLLYDLQSQTAAQAQLRRYQLISQALKAQPALMADASFADKLHQKLAEEPIHFLPQRKPKAPYFKTAALALAASLTAVAVIVPVMQKFSPNTPFSSAQTAQLEAAFSGRNLALNDAQKPTKRLYPVNKRFQDYLQAHNGSMYTNGAASLQTRTQLASFGQGGQ